MGCYPACCLLVEVVELDELGAFGLVGPEDDLVLVLVCLFEDVSDNRAKGGNVPVGEKPAALELLSFEVGVSDVNGVDAYSGKSIEHFESFGWV